MARAILAALAMLFAAPACAEGPDIAHRIIEESDGTRTLVHEAVIDAPVSRVWQSLTTEEGWQDWGPTFAKIDLRNGGSIESGYHDGAAPGDPRNIRHRILAIVPERLLVLQVEQAPEGGPVDIAMLRQMWGIYELDPLEDGQTRLRINGLGYGPGEDFDRLLEFFVTGNAYSIELLRKNIARSRSETHD